MKSFRHRFMGALMLRTDVYEDVENDSTATGQALAVVILSSAASAIGVGHGSDFFELLRNAVAALGAWLLWAAITFFVGTKILPVPSMYATWGQLLRTTGFAAAPGVIQVLAVVPFGLFRLLVFLGASIWMVVTFVLAVKQALDYESAWRAVLVTLIGGVIYLAVRLFVF